MWNVIRIQTVRIFMTSPIVTLVRVQPDVHLDISRQILEKSLHSDVRATQIKDIRQRDSLTNHFEQYPSVNVAEAIARSQCTLLVLDTPMV